MLYLPALWFHQVGQRCGRGPSSQDVECAIAVNWWYDMKMEGHLWSVAQFIRRTTWLLDGQVDGAEDEID
jgi:jumonji domain-containing protein 7